MSCESKAVLLKSDFDIPYDIDSASLLISGFKAVDQNSHPFLPYKKTGTQFFDKRKDNYSVLIVLQNNNSKDLLMQRIDMKCSYFEKISKKKCKDYHSIFIKGQIFEVSHNDNSSNVALYRRINGLTNKRRWY